jgi:hypothetical protein
MAAGTGADDWGSKGASSLGNILSSLCPVRLWILTVWNMDAGRSSYPKSSVVSGRWGKACCCSVSRYLRWLRSRSRSTTDTSHVRLLSFSNIPVTVSCSCDIWGTIFCLKIRQASGQNSVICLYDGCSFVVNWISEMLHVHFSLAWRSHFGRMPLWSVLRCWLRKPAP